MSGYAKAEEAAEWLDEGHRAGRRHEPLPAAYRPADIAGAYDIQRAFVKRLAARGRPAHGWKIALTAETMQQMVGIDRAVGGVIAAERILHSPAELTAAGYGRVCIECEVALRLGRDLAPGGAPFSEADIAGAVDACAAAFEIADDRNADYSALDALSLIADNAWNAGMVLGEVGPPRDAADLAAATAVLEIDGEEVGRGVGADAMGHPLNGLRFLADELTGLGDTLKAGNWVLTGTVIRTQFPAVGQTLVYRHSLLGEVRASVV